ncbi:chorion class A protein PC292-like [Leguminivora glycinivorella]|uniref:chorion class A protein PC292-like n=1 Tax=Leguminivora glycinivorella TaxID=1035111 RepID=UPI00200DE33A|nr:chorion class A protein PC292-like [Leguminivora glycinivorella]
MSINKLSICVVACLLQHALCQTVLSLNNCGCQSQPQGLNLGNLGLAVGNPTFSISNPNCNCNGGLSLGNAGNGINLGSLGAPNFNFGNNCNNVVQGTSEQCGYGDVAIVGSLPVQGPTAVCGNVPVIGYVVFEGDVPAGGLVSVVDPCGCQCNQ